MKPTFLVDLNLPYHLELWNNPGFIHVKDIKDELTDEEIWEYSKKRDLIIITYHSRRKKHSVQPRIPA